MKQSKAFTMIELVFVIVIIGILAAVAIPKFSATRTDAQASVIATRLSNCIQLAAKGYFLNHAFDVNDSNCVEIVSKINCYELTADDSNGTLFIKDVANASSSCKAGQVLTLKNKLSSALGMTHNF